jgi:EpsI family protein
MVASAGPLYVTHLSSGPGVGRATLAHPQAAGRWTMSDSRLPDYKPHFHNAHASVRLAYENEGKQVGLYIAYYARQREGAELVGYGNDLVGSRGGKWARIAESKRAGPAGPVMQSRLQSESHQLLTWHWYWVGGTKTVRPEEVKLRQALDRLLGYRDEAAVVVLYTAGDTGRAGEVLDDFLRAMGPSIDQSLLKVSFVARENGGD